MLIKEYRIPLPLSVDEYRIAQLYMIQKKSREESSGAGSGVEILINEPYENGPGGSGQYTHKIYHIGSHLPGWIKAILPKSALRVEEEAWNAYPYTKTIYRCPFVEKFVLEIETVYKSDGGDQDNVFSLSDSEMRNRLVDLLDIVRDPISSGDYKKEEDPTLFQSEKTKRGPLSDTWLDEYKQATKRGHKEKNVMCAYKLCKVEFRYWGMQSKVERFIHDIGLRKTMLRAHRQAWAWQDEYHGLQLSDIRRLEMETQAALAKKMGEVYEQEGLQQPKSVINNSSSKSEEKEEVNQTQADRHSISTGISGSSDTITQAKEDGASQTGNAVGVRRRSYGSKTSFGGGSRQNLSDWRVESIEQLRADSSEDDEFFDAQEEMEKASLSSKSNPSLFRSSSMEMLSDSEFMDTAPPPGTKSPDHQDNEVFSSFDRRMEHMRQLNMSHSLDSALPAAPATPNLSPPSTSTCRITVLFMVFHGGSILDTGSDQHATKHADISTLRATFESVVRAHYPAIQGHIAIRLVPCPYICTETLRLLSSLNPIGFDAQSVQDSEVGNIMRESLPIGAISLFATSSPDYQDIVNRVVNKANSVYNEFLRSEEGNGFAGQVCMVGDCTGSIIGYDSLCQSHNPSLSRNNSHYGSHEGLPEGSDHTDSETDHHVFRKTNLETIKQMSLSNPDLVDDHGPTASQGSTRTSQYVEHNSKPQHDSNNVANNAHVKKMLQPTLSSSSHHKYLPLPSSRRTSTGSQSDTGAKLDFEVSDFFMFGSPLALVLAYRRINSGCLPRPSCHQIYNLFHPMDPSVARIEPLLCDRFRVAPPIKVPRYQKFPLGDGQSIHLVETIQSSPHLFTDYSSSSSQNASEQPPPLERRHSNMSITSQASGHGELTISNITSVTRRWWGNKRVDYALYCPDALNNFPTSSLPYILHGSYWESTDVVSFILRQVVRQDVLTLQTADGEQEVSQFKPGQPREKWLKRRTTIKLRNVAPNHRANDVLVVEDKPQVLTARFMYGPLDMVSLTGEKVDVHIMVNPPEGDWLYFGTEMSDSSGRITYEIPGDKRLSQGMYPVKMVVRGDHTSVDFFLTVLPPMTETVVFSVDGSFTASVSIMGKDPKVRPGAVDVVRHWQELGYLILYITARPDMQHKKVVAWLAQHNFPHGMVAFMDGVYSNPLQQKANYLKSLKQEAEIKINAAYGSSKDIAVYQSLNVDPLSTYIVGKASKKQHKECVVLQNGYAVHLNDLSSHGGSRPAVGNARMFIRKSCFSLPGQKRYKHSNSKKSVARRTTSLPYKTNDLPVNSHPVNTTGIVISESGNTIVDAGHMTSGKAVRARGTSPRPKFTQV